MELREAYQRLGVEPGTAPKTARRAYLKLLKVHRPETDPAGFQALREAWETIEDAKDWEIGALDRAPKPMDAPPEDPFRRGKDPQYGHMPWSVPRRSWGQQVILAMSRPPEAVAHAEEVGRAIFARADWAGGARSGPVAGSEGGPCRDSDPLAKFVERMARANDAERVTIAREAVDAMPGSAEAYRLLHGAQIVGAPMEDAAETLRAAHRAGLPGFLEPLLRQHPEHLLPEELDEARREAGHRLDPAAVAGALLARGDATGAVRAMRWGIDSALQGAEAYVPSVHVTLDFVLQLYRHLHPGAARELYDHLRRWMRDAGRETELRGSDLAAAYHLAGELAGLPRSFPASVQAALARGILDGDPSFAGTDLAQWTADEGEAATRAAEVLAVHAPTLHRSVGPFLDRPGASVDAPFPAPKMKHWGDPSSGGSGWSDGSAKVASPTPSSSTVQKIGLAVLASLMGMAVSQLAGNGRIRQAPTEVATGALAAGVIQTRASADRVCARTPSLSDPRCMAARRWAKAIRSSGDCAVLRRAADEYRRAVKASDATEPLAHLFMSEAVLDLDRATRVTCDSSVSRPSTGPVTP